MDPMDLNDQVNALMHKFRSEDERDAFLAEFTRLMDSHQPAQKSAAPEKASKSPKKQVSFEEEPVFSQQLLKKLKALVDNSAPSTSEKPDRIDLTQRHNENNHSRRKKHNDWSTEYESEVSESEEYSSRSRSKRRSSGRKRSRRDYSPSSGSDSDYEGRRRKRKSAVLTTGANKVEHLIRLPHHYVFRQGRAIEFDEARLSEFVFGFTEWIDKYHPHRYDIVVILIKLLALLMKQTAATSWEEVKSAFSHIAQQVERGNLRWNNLSEIERMLGDAKIDSLRSAANKKNSDQSNNNQKKGKGKGKSASTSGARFACFAFNAGDCSQSSSHVFKGKLLEHVCQTCLGDDVTSPFAKDVCPKHAKSGKSEDKASKN